MNPLIISALPKVRSIATGLLGVVALIVSTSSASAKTFKFVYNGYFSRADALNTVNFTDPTQFTATALFDDTSTNIAARVGVQGFVAYSPLWATLTIDGHSYNVTTYNQNPTQGITVAIFDSTTPFGLDHYATGFLQNPLADGSGFIGDWLSSTPSFSAAHLTSTVFTDYVGVGFGSGPASSPGQPNTVVPIPLSDATGNSYFLTLGNYDQEASSGLLNTARIQAVPESSNVKGVLITAGVLLALRLRRKSIG